MLLLEERFGVELPADVSPKWMTMRAASGSTQMVGLHFLWVFREVAAKLVGGPGEDPSCRAASRRPG